MLQPGLSRAVPMGILGFIGGALLALVIRMLQGLDPAGSVGAALVLGAFISAGVFIWGIGGFDPRMSVHGDHAEGAHAEEEHAVVKAVPPKDPAPVSILGAFTWQVTFWTILGLVSYQLFSPNLYF